MARFNIYVPSYKRAKTCTAHEMLQYCTYVVRKSEYESYEEALRGIENVSIISVEDDKICGLTEVNQWLIDNAEEELICVLDDDIHHWYYRLDTNEAISKSELVMTELERIGQIMLDLGIGFAATDPTCTIWNYAQEFEFKGTAGAVRWINRPVFKSKCVKELEYNYDIDLVLQELLSNRIVLKPKYFCSKGLTDTNTGGASDKKRGDQIASINMMKTKWGKYFGYNFKTNKPKILVKR